jgi:hypothetical protein
MRTFTMGRRRQRRRAGLVAGLVGVVGVVGLAASAGASVAAVRGSTSAELAQLKTKLLVKSDFPKGWSTQGKVATSSGQGSNSFPGMSQLAGCLGISQSILELNEPSVTSPNFVSSSQTQNVQENLGIFPSAKVGNEEEESLGNAKVPTCMDSLLNGPEKSQLQSSFGKGYTVGTVNVAAISPSILIPHSSGFVMSFPVTNQGQTITTSVALIDAFRGKDGVQLMVTSVGSALSSATQKHALTVAYNRM